MYQNLIKPIGDFFVAFILLTILSPIIIVTGFFLFFSNKGNIFFYQQRPGLHCKPFTILKFKTMKDAFDENGNPLPDEFRLTKTGKIIRSLSLDELLQLVNVLKGDMSLVGPRPLLMQYLARYNSEQIKRQNVKPGITGWAQVNGRNAISWEQKFKLDIEYINNVAILFDIKILIMTILNVIKRSGINNDSHVTMEEFRG